MNYNRKFLNACYGVKGLHASNKQIYDKVTAFDKNSLYPSLKPLILKMRNERPLTREEIDRQICEVLNNEHN